MDDESKTWVFGFLALLVFSLLFIGCIGEIKQHEDRGHHLKYSWTLGTWVWVDEHGHLVP